MKHRHLMLALIWLMMFVAYFDRINITVAGPAIAKTLGLGPAAFGGILAAFTFGYALMQFPGGYLADRLGSRRLLIAALVIWSIFTGLTGFATSVTALIVVRVCFGLGEGLENGAQFKLIGEYFPSRERSAANAVFLTALSLGPAVAAPLAAWFVVHLGWQAMFWWFALPGLAVAGLLAIFLPHAPPPGVAPPSAFWGFIGWMPSYLNAARHIALAQLGLAASIPYFCGFLGTLTFGWLGSTALSRRRPLLVAAGYVLAGIALFAAFTAADPAQCIAGLSVAAFGLYGGFGPFWAIALDLVPAPISGAFTGFVNFGGQIGGFVAPIVVGAIVAATKSFAGGFAFMIGALIVAAGSLAALDITMNRQHRAAQPAGLRRA